MKLENIVLLSDSYKYSHNVQYPEGMTQMFSYFESRGSERGWDKTVFFGLQYFLKEYLSKGISVEDVEEAASFMKLHGEPFNYEGWMYIAKDLEGKLPVRIRAVPEGTLVPNHNILMSIESTDERVPWVANFLETLLVQCWYPSTVATQSYYIKNLIRKYLEKTTDLSENDLEGALLFMLHDFGFRGVSSVESAMIGGAAHLVNFMGSDTVAGIWAANKYYNHEMAGFSIPATEHSTMTMWGRENEAEAYRNLLKQYKDQPIFACVSDSYDIFNAAENIWGGELKDEVIKYPGTLVIRPDSGTPWEIVPKLLSKLENAFGSTVNSKGFKKLNHNVKVIQGDGVNIDSIEKILNETEKIGFAADNLAFGMGGALLQQVNRDTQKFAFKCSSAIIDGKMVDVYKDPITDSSKRSKKGELELCRFDNGDLFTMRRNKKSLEHTILEDVFLNGEILRDQSLEDIRSKVK